MLREGCQNKGLKDLQKRGEGEDGTIGRCPFNGDTFGKRSQKDSCFDPYRVGKKGSETIRRQKHLHEGISNPKTSPSY